MITSADQGSVCVDLHTSGVHVCRDEVEWRADLFCLWMKA